MRMDRLARALTTTGTVLMAVALVALAPGGVEAQWSVCDGNWVDYYVGSSPLRDAETDTAIHQDDMTYGQQKASGFSDISSGFYAGQDPPALPSQGTCNPAICLSPPCPPGAYATNCGPTASLQWYYFDDPASTPPNVTGDVLCMRVRVDAKPTDNQGLKNSHWNFLLDSGESAIGGPAAPDGYKEFWLDLNGRQAGTLDVFFQNNSSQNMDTARSTIANYTTANWRVVENNTAGNTWYDNTQPNNPPWNYEWWVEIWVPVTDLRTAATGGTQVVQGPAHPMKFFISTGTSNTDPLQTDCIGTGAHANPNPPCCDPLSPCNVGQTTPVTLAAFSSRPARGGVEVEWWTATETANAGFELWAETADGPVKVHSDLIPSREGDSLVPQQYRQFVSRPNVKWFHVYDFDQRGEPKVHGPFEVGQVYGQVPNPEPVNWSAIRADHDRKAAARVKAALASLPSRIAEQPGEAKATGRTGVQPLADLGVEAEGLYRVTSEQLLAAGIDLASVDPSAIALSNRGEAVPIRVEAARGGGFGPGAYLEFYGVGLDTLYTRTNVYRLSLDRSQARRVGVDSAPATGVSPEYHQEQLVVENDRVYSFSSPTGDPWYDTRMLAFTTPGSWTFPFTVDHTAVGEGSLSVELWGSTDFARNPDHHVQVLVNGEVVGDELFDGIHPHTMSATLREGLLNEGQNLLELRLPGDSGADWDIVMLDRFSVSYPRALVARDGRLTFDTDSSSSTVDGLPSPDVVAYRVDRSGVTRLGRVSVAPGAPYSVTFRGVSQGDARFLVSAASALRTPSITVVPAWQDLFGREAEYLVIAHPDFVAGIQPLVDARRADGLTVKVVDVEQLFSQLGHGVFDPQAVKDYIVAAADRLGTRAVVLVGGDTYDYQDVLQLGSVSFIPTLYAATHYVVSFAPADALFGDLDGDGVQDLAIGRFPVRTSAELQSAVAKTLAYPEAGHAGTAVFAADDRDGGLSFSATSDSLISTLDPSWSVERAYIDELGASGARAALMDALNRGVALVDFFGHSGPSTWTSDGLFNASDATSLANAGRPSVVLQWGCWNTYFVDPRYNTLGHKLMLSGDRGAAAVMGAASLTFSDSDEAIGSAVLSRVVEPGLPLGQAIVDAKQAIGANPALRDVLVGWILLGDPMLVIER